MESWFATGTWPRFLLRGRLRLEVRLLPLRVCLFVCLVAFNVARTNACAGGEMKRVTVELGGKSPLILFDDCNVEDAVNGILLANFYSNGEVLRDGSEVCVLIDSFF